MQYNWYYQLFCKNTTFTVFVSFPTKKTMKFTRSCAFPQKRLILRFTNVKKNKISRILNPPSWQLTLANLLSIYYFDAQILTWHANLMYFVNIFHLLIILSPLTQIIPVSTKISTSFL